jgi:hypothetical protein
MTIDLNRLAFWNIRHIDYHHRAKIRPSQSDNSSVACSRQIFIWNVDINSIISIWTYSGDINFVIGIRRITVDPWVFISLPNALCIRIMLTQALSIAAKNVKNLFKINVVATGFILINIRVLSWQDMIHPNVIHI